MSNRRKVKKQPDWISVYRLTFKSAAWQALSVGARAVYVELAANYNTRMENAVYLSVRTGAKRLGVSKTTVVKWLRELQHYGFIVLIRGGSLGIEGYGLAQTFRLTDRPYANSRPTFDFQNWTGELFEPAKHTMTEADKERRNRDRKKQNPVPAAGTPRTSGRDIVESGRASSLCTSGRDIETPPDRTSGRDTTSLTISRETEADVAPLDAAQPAVPSNGHDIEQPDPELEERPAWTIPVLTEIPWTDELLHQLRRTNGTGSPLPIEDLSIPTFLRRG
jgi:hypothetical protein